MRAQDCHRHCFKKKINAIFRVQYHHSRSEFLGMRTVCLLTRWFCCSQRVGSKLFACNNVKKNEWQEVLGTVALLHF